MTDVCVVHGTPIKQYMQSCSIGLLEINPYFPDYLHVGPEPVVSANLSFLRVV